MIRTLQLRWDAALADYGQKRALFDAADLDAEESKKLTDDWVEAAWRLIDDTLSPDGDALVEKLNILRDLTFGSVSDVTFDALRNDAKLLRMPTSLEEVRERAELEIRAAEAELAALPPNSADEIVSPVIDKLSSAERFLVNLPAATIGQALRRIEVAFKGGALTGTGVSFEELIDEAKGLLP